MVDRGNVNSRGIGKTFSLNPTKVGGFTYKRYTETQPVVYFYKSKILAPSTSSIWHGRIWPF